MAIHELEPIGKASVYAHELRDVADLLDRCPELAEVDDWYGAALRMLDELSALDVGIDDELDLDDDEDGE